MEPRKGSFLVELIPTDKSADAPFERELSPCLLTRELFAGIPVGVQLGNIGRYPVPALHLLHKTGQVIQRHRNSNQAILALLNVWTLRKLESFFLFGHSLAKRHDDDAIMVGRIQRQCGQLADCGVAHLEVAKISGLDVMAASYHRSGGKVFLDKTSHMLRRVSYAARVL